MRLSIILPTLNAAPHLHALLSKLASCDAEIIVSDGHSTDKSIEIALMHSARLAIGHKGRGQQLRNGAKIAQSEWLLFLHADTCLSPNWHDAVQTHITQSPNKAGYFHFSFQKPTSNKTRAQARFIEYMVAIRTRLFALPYGDQGLLISRALYEKYGGYPDWPLFEDVAIVKALGRKNLRPIRARIHTNPMRYEQRGYIKCACANLRLYRQFRKGEDITHLAQHYYANIH